MFLRTLAYFIIGKKLAMLGKDYNDLQNLPYSPLAMPVGSCG